MPILRQAFSLSDVSIMIKSAIIFFGSQSSVTKPLCYECIITRRDKLDCWTSLPLGGQKTQCESLYLWRTHHINLCSNVVLHVHHAFAKSALSVKNLENWSVKNQMLHRWLVVALIVGFLLTAADLADIAWFRAPFLEHLCNGLSPAITPIKFRSKGNSCNIW